MFLMPKKTWLSVWGYGHVSVLDFYPLYTCIEVPLYVYVCVLYTYTYNIHIHI